MKSGICFVRCRFNGKGDTDSARLRLAVVEACLREAGLQFWSDVRDETGCRAIVAVLVVFGRLPYRAVRSAWCTEEVGGVSVTHPRTAREMADLLFDFLGLSAQSTYCAPAGTSGSHIPVEFNQARNLSIVANFPASSAMSA